MWRRRVPDTGRHLRDEGCRTRPSIPNLLANASSRCVDENEALQAGVGHGGFYETMGKERLQSTGITPEKLREEISKRTLNEAYVRFATKVLTAPRDDALVADRQQLLIEKMASMEDRLADGRPWLCGDQFTLADIALAPRIEMFPVVGVQDLYERFPRIGQFMERMKARPSWAASAFRPEPGEAERVVNPVASASRDVLLGNAVAAGSRRD